MADPWTELHSGLAALDIPCDTDFEGRVRAFLEELTRWNRVLRLTGYRDESARVRHLVLESLLLLAVLPLPASPLLDIGSGAGVPGLVLKLARPDWTVALMEGNRRRVNFLRHVVRRLEVHDVTILAGRAEAFRAAPELQQAFRTVTLRAVGPLATAVALARPFVQPRGYAVIPLGTGQARPVGTVRSVCLTEPSVGLRLRRQFLIIRAAGQTNDVPRETGRPRGSDPRGGEPKGGRR